MNEDKVTGRQECEECCRLLDIHFVFLMLGELLDCLPNLEVSTRRNIGIKKAFGM